MFLRCLNKLIIVLFLLSFFPVGAHAAELTAEKIRYSSSADKVRIVVDLSGAPDFKASSGFGKRVVVDLGVATTAKDIKDIILSDPVFRQAKLFTVDKNKLLLDIMLNTETEYKAFLLQGPWRLVVDVMKNYQRQEETLVAPGLTYVLSKELVNGAPLKIYTMEVDPAKWEVRPAMASGQVVGREKLKDIVARSKAAAGVNASYFGTDGWVIGNLKLNGNIVSSEKMSRTAFLVYPDGKMEITPVSYSGELSAGGSRFTVGGVNRERLNDELIVYNKEYAAATGTNSYGYEVSIDGKGCVVNINPKGNSPLPEAGFVLSGHGKAVDFLKTLTIGEKVTFKQTLGEKGDRAKMVLGAGPRLVTAGKVTLAGQTENFPPDITQGRAPRTAVGITKDGKVLLLVADGRSSASRGLTLGELAEKMIAAGAVDAMNLDGGGSSEMVIGGEIMNGPSDGQERRISVGLGVFTRSQ